MGLLDIAPVEMELDNQVSMKTLISWLRDHTLDGSIYEQGDRYVNAYGNKEINWFTDTGRRRTTRVYPFTIDEENTLVPVKKINNSGEKLPLYLMRYYMEDEELQMEDIPWYVKVAAEKYFNIEILKTF